MQIEIEYSTQVRTATGVSREQVDVPEECSLAQALAHVLTLHPKLSPWIDVNGLPRPGLLLFVNDQSPTDSVNTRLKPDDQVAMMSMVSGG